MPQVIEEKWAALEAEIVDSEQPGVFLKCRPEAIGLRAAARELALAVLDELGTFMVRNHNWVEMVDPIRARIEKLK